MSDSSGPARTSALHTDLQQDRAARDWLHTANRYADLSGNTAQRYWVAMAQAMAAMYAPTPQPRRVITITDRARHTIETTPSAPAAQLTGLAARAHAHLGHHAQADVELRAARTIFGDLGAVQINEPFFGFPAHEMTMYSSQVLSRTGAATAWDEQNRALAGYAADDPMDRPLILLDRARYLTGQGDADHAARVAGDEQIRPRLGPIRPDKQRWEIALREAVPYLTPPYGTRERRWPPRTPLPPCPGCGAPVRDAYLQDRVSLIMVPCGQRLIVQGLEVET